MRNDWGTGGMQNGARGIGRALPVLLGLSLALGGCFAVGAPTNQRVTLPDPPRDSGAPPPAVREHQRILSAYSGTYDDPRLEGLVRQTVEKLVAASERPDQRYRITILPLTPSRCRADSSTSRVA
jgi:hypothetical protein